MNVMKGLVALCLLTTSFFCQASYLPKEKRVNGGVAIVPIYSASAKKPTAYFYGRKVAVINDHKEWLAIIGLPITLRSGKQLLRVVNPVQHQYTFKIRRQSYPVQRISLKDTTRVRLSAKDQSRALSEAKRIHAYTTRFSSAPFLRHAFTKPVSGRISGAFGVRRFYNGVKGSPHRGLDIAAKIGTPVRAPANGTVVMTGNFFYLGRTLLLDHGNGLMTLYAHLNRLNVSRGRHVSRGQVIAEVGNTGRTSGPHLHWGVILNSARVNPQYFL